jgi:hypothetical protein
LQRLDAIGQITSGVAHDFNNLLSVVLTNPRLLSHSLREPGDREGIELIRSAAERRARPKPEFFPGCLVVKKGSKTRGRTSSGIPEPVSLTINPTYCRRLLARRQAPLEQGGRASNYHNFVVSLTS